mgnify:CR=1 FL=1
MGMGLNSPSVCLSTRFVVFIPGVDFRAGFPRGIGIAVGSEELTNRTIVTAAMQKQRPAPTEITVP